MSTQIRTIDKQNLAQYVHEQTLNQLKQLLIKRHKPPIILFQCGEYIFELTARYSLNNKPLANIDNKIAAFSIKLTFTQNNKSYEKFEKAKEMEDYLGRMFDSGHPGYNISAEKMLEARKVIAENNILPDIVESEFRKVIKDVHQPLTSDPITSQIPKDEVQEMLDESLHIIKPGYYINFTRPVSDYTIPSIIDYTNWSKYGQKYSYSETVCAVSDLDKIKNHIESLTRDPGKPFNQR